MNRQILILVVTLMIAYDLSIHLIYLVGKENFFIDRKINYWPNFGGHRRAYQIFWSVYWATAFILLLLYLAK